MRGVKMVVCVCVGICVRFYLFVVFEVHPQLSDDTSARGLRLWHAAHLLPLYTTHTFNRTPMNRNTPSLRFVFPFSLASV